MTARVAEARESLRQLADRIDELTKLSALPGESVHGTVVRALREFGLVFGAARTIELARTGRLDPAQHARLTLGVPHAEWSPTERSALPTVRIRVPGPQLHAAALAEYLDGSLKLVLRAEGACPPAPLARLVSPGVYVAQVLSPAELEPFVAFDGPAVAAIVPEGAALFTHDPRRGARSWQRLDVTSLPRPPRRALGGISVAQQSEDLTLLGELASDPPALTEDDRPEVDPTDRLASWLLTQSGLSGDAPA